MRISRIGYLHLRVYAFGGSDVLSEISLDRTRMATIKRGAFKGKKVTYASTGRIEEFRKLAGDFMMDVFDLLPGDYLITDKSSLRDFTDFGSSDTSPLWRRITETYGIRTTDVPSERIVDIFTEIQARRSAQ